MNEVQVPLTIPRLLALAAERYGDHPAVVESGVSVSYRRLAELVRRTARSYLAVGVRPGDRVAVWAPNRLEFVLALLGAQSAGASVVPMNTRYRGHEAAVILRRSRASALVLANGFLGADFAAMLRDAATEGAGTGEEAGPGDRDGAVREPGPEGSGPVPGLPWLRTVVDLGADRSVDGLLSWDDFVARADEVPEEEGARIAREVSPDDLSDIMFTSGTTGLPKGVMSAHRQTIGTALVWAEGAALSHTDRYAIVNPFFHGFGYKTGVIASIAVGATIHPVATFDADRLLELIQEARISVLPGAPTLFVSLLDHPRLREFDLSSLRFATAGAATVPESLFRRMREELGFDTVAQAYGLTECVVATRSRPGEDPAHVERTTGPAVPGIEIRVVGPDGKDVAEGGDGEILLRGDNVMLGYFEDEEATRAAVDAEGWLRTGDVGRLDEHGCLKITDRIKDVIIVGGFNVYPAEVENALADHPQIAEAAVVGVPDARLGAVPCAYVVPRRGADPTAGDVIAYCKERLANFKVPRRVIVLSDLPRNASGKILKTSLRQRLS
ncbi:AMP-binding protein [Streptomyces sp. NPDC058375]|uniref:AMP-binding protein n=1 Tax=Streptomyces sp. NPDC058375 TaxID=3346467 RepID=UPI00364B9E21